VLKTDGPLQNRMQRRARWLAGVMVACIGLVSLWTPFLQNGYYYRWFTGWGLLAAGGVALVTLVLAYTGYAYWVFRGKISPEDGYH